MGMKRVAARGGGACSTCACAFLSSHNALLPPRRPIRDYSGPKFQKLVRRSEAEGALTKYEPFIVASRNFP